MLISWNRACNLVCRPRFFPVCYDRLYEKTADHSQFPDPALRFDAVMTRSAVRPATARKSCPAGIDTY
jgi:hypothetical protein